MRVDPAVSGRSNDNHAALVRDLADLVAMRSISNDGQHQKEIGDSAALTAEMVRRSGHTDRIPLCTS